MENLRHRIDVTLVNKEKDCLKCTSKPGYVLQKIFENNSVGIRKSKVASKSNLLFIETDSKMDMNILVATKKYLISVIIQLSQNIMIVKTNSSLEK